MVRRVQVEGQPISQTCSTFGFTRPVFYKAQAALDADGLPGLVPKKRGPRAGHKLTDEVLDVLEQARVEDRTLGPVALVQLARERCGLTVHLRSLQRALARRKKNGESAPEEESMPEPKRLVRNYERMREQARVAQSAGGAGYGLLVQRGLAAWIDAWSLYRPAKAGLRPSSSCRTSSDPGACSEDVALPAGLHPAVVRQLAQMARGPLKEVLR